MLTVGDANEAKCERKPEMNHPGLSRAAVFFSACALSPADSPTRSQPF